MNAFTCPECYDEHPADEAHDKIDNEWYCESCYEYVFDKRAREEDIEALHMWADFKRKEMKEEGRY